MLNIKDLKFILDKTGLLLKTLLSLIEEERDYNLVLDSIASRLTTSEIKNLDITKELKTKLTLYHLTRDKNYDIEEKSYICEILSQNFKQVYRRGFLLKKGQKKIINKFISVINDTNINKQKIMNLSDDFDKVGRKDVGGHILEWVNIINKSKEAIISPN